MKLASLKLESFRCFQQAEFDLSSDIVAIYGRNGVGKTAVCDAIEFALLGSVGRYLRKQNAPDYLPCRFTGGGVSVHLALADSSSHWIERTRGRDPDAKWQLSGSGGWHNDNDFLFGFLLDPELSPPRREKEPVAEYIRATALLSQHSIRNFIEENATTRSTVLAYLAGVGAVQRRLDKAERVLEEVERSGRTEVQRLSETKQIADAGALVAAEQEGRIASIQEQLAGERVTRDSLAQALQVAGISVDLNTIPDEDAEALPALVRGRCSEQIALYENRLRLLAEIETIGQAHTSRLGQRDILSQNITNGRSRQQTVLGEENGTAQKFQDLERQIGDLEPRISVQQARVNLLKQLQELQRKQVELEISLAAAKEEQQKVHGALITFRNLLERLDIDLVQIAHDEEACQQRGQNVLSELLNLPVLQQAIAGYPNLATAAVNQTVNVHVLNGAVGSLVGRKTELEARLQSVERRLNETNLRVSQTRASVEEASGLASRLRQYATSRECPLCGHQHPTTSALQEAIEARLSAIPEALRTIAADLQTLVQEKMSLSFTVEASRQQLEEWQQSLQSRRRERDEAVRIIGNALEEKNRTVEETMSALRLAREQARSLQTDDLSQLGDLAVALSTGESQLTALESKKAELVTLREGTRNQWSSLNNERLNLEQLLNQWEESAAQLAAEIQAYRTKCLQLELVEDATVDMLISARRQISEKLTALQSVQKLAEQYALSCKLIATELDRNQIRSQLQDAQKSVEQLTKEMRALDSAEGEIKRWITVLSEHVNRAVTDRITAHKSEINNLFKAMIPTPYLFEEIRMSKEGDGLSLGLRYRGQEEDAGEPQFYLSNAQANVLALSLFLSFTRAQRWAKLETILLDDPVQHLDDLDAVAFLDTLRSVALGGRGPRKQVIVSTCNQNLYLQMIRKFGILESMGLQFTGISLLDRGEAGPEVHYDFGGTSGKRYLREAV